MKAKRITISMSLGQVLPDGAELPSDAPEGQDVEITTSVRAVPVDDHPGRFSLEESVSLNGVVRLLRRGDVIETRRLQGPGYVLTTIVKRGDS